MDGSQPGVGLRWARAAVVVALLGPTPQPVTGPGGCVPVSQAACAFACGALSDGCGGVIDCGPCGVGQACVNNACQCAPSTCADQGFDCGDFMSSISPGCGEVLNCGTCPANAVCVQNRCQCVPATCGDRQCGIWPDGCGGSIACGSCPQSQLCSTDGRHCECSPTTCAAEHAVCGNLSDGCGGTVYCGNCTGNQVCSSNNTCECVPTTCEQERKNCGIISDGCPGPGTLDCGVCAATEFCNSSKVCECLPSTCHAQMSTCGHISDQCGYPHQVVQVSHWLRPINLIDCGGCDTSAVCNGTSASSIYVDPCTSVDMMSCGVQAGCQPRVSCTGFFDVQLLATDIPVLAGPTTCLTCPDGTHPNLDHTRCVDCPSGYAGLAGVCTPCANFSMRHVPNEARSSCVCVPLTCEEAAATCGTLDNLCGGVIDCGGCSNNTWGDPDVCTDNRCQCVPATCESAPVRTVCGPTTGRVEAECSILGASCGTILDGCGSTLQCGSCTSNSSYASICDDYSCKCVPTSCAAEGRTCGTISDRCGGTLFCGLCVDNACEVLLYADNLHNVTYTPQLHSVDLHGVAGDVSVMIGDTVHFNWNGQHQWDHLHVTAYLDNVSATCPQTISNLLSSDDPHFFGTYQTGHVVSATSSGSARYLTIQAPCQVSSTGIGCNFAYRFESIPLQSLPAQAATVYQWPHAPVSTFVPHTVPSQWREGTYCIGTSTSSATRLTLHVLTPACDHTRLGRGSPCDLPPPSCGSDVAHISLPSLAPLNSVFANATCPELKLLLSYFDVMCSTNIATAVPDMLQSGGDGTLVSLCPVTCGSCPVEVVDTADYGANSTLCAAQNGSCHTEWRWPYNERTQCKTRRLTEFRAGKSFCNVDNTCSCSPATCASQGFTCGDASDLCGSSLFCGTCSNTTMACYDNTCSTIRPEPEPEPEPEPLITFCEQTGHIYEYIEFTESCSHSEHNCIHGFRHLSWHDARLEAERKGRLLSADYNSTLEIRGQGYLAIVTSQAEQECLTSLTDKSGWLGSTDNFSEGLWQWVDGSNMSSNSYSNWDAFEPNSTQGHNFLLMNNGIYSLGRWSAATFDAYTLGFFLEFEPNMPIPEPEPEPEPNVLCNAGSMPNVDRTDCIPCANISEVFCVPALPSSQPLNANQSQASRSVICVEPACVDGACVSTQGDVCQRCGAGTGPNDAGTACVTCVSSISAHGERCKQCYPGSQPNWLAGGVSCINCSTLASNFASHDGKVCLACSTGQEPDEEHAECLECTPRQISNGSICEACPGGMLPMDGMTKCEHMHVEMTLNGDMNSWDMLQRSQFESAFISDVAAMIGVALNRVIVTDVRSGSIVVVWEIAPSGVVSGGRFYSSGEQPEDLFVRFQNVVMPNSTFAGYSIVEPIFQNIKVLVGNLNECATLFPCQHGTCIQRIGNYSCVCDSGYGGRHCDHDINECESNPCNNGATCFEAVDSYSCSCAVGYEGSNCNGDVDECSSGPCLHGATCTHGVDTFSCACAAGYMSERCLVDIDECASAPCASSSTCYDLIDAYYCDCASGWQGINCMDDIDECQSDPCLHNSTCTDGVDSFVCSCALGYGYDDQCSYDIDECASSPCQNGATCTDSYGSNECRSVGMVPIRATNTSCMPASCTTQCTLHGQIAKGDYRCNCAIGWKGRNCDTDIDECISLPCMNGATCYDSTNRPSVNYGQLVCSCTPGFTGIHCQTDIDECQSLPCRGQQIFDRCTDIVDGYLCTCEAGFQGHNCDQDVDECLSRPCNNGGSCSHGFGTNVFFCNCTRGFVGRHCQINVDDCISSPCHHQGHCVDEIDAFRCICNVGWEGLHCETDIAECRGHFHPFVGPRPCQNGAVCKESTIDATINVGEFRCFCPYGFSGTACELDLDECASEPCKNGASCSDAAGDYVCTCVAGFGGKTCSLAVDTYDSCLQSSLCRARLGMTEVLIASSFVAIPGLFCLAVWCLRYRAKQVCVAPLSKAKYKYQERIEQSKARLQALESRVRRAVRLHQVRLSIAFKQADADQSGSLNKEELAEILRDFDVSFSSKEIGEVLGLIDSDKDGSISYSEFLDFFSQEDLEPLEGDHTESTDGSEIETDQSSELSDQSEPAESREACVRDGTLGVTVHRAVQLAAPTNIVKCDNVHAYVEIHCVNGLQHPVFQTSEQPSGSSLSWSPPERFEFAIAEAEALQHDWGIIAVAKARTLAATGTDECDIVLGAVHVPLKPYFDDDSGWCSWKLSKRFRLHDEVRCTESSTFAVDSELKKSHIERLNMNGQYVILNP